MWIQKITKESAELDLSGKIDPSKSRIKIDERLKVSHDRYLRGHLRRYELTCDVMKLTNVNAEVVVDLGTSILYHPEMKSIYDKAKFIFTGGSHLRDPKDLWVDIDLEKSYLPLASESVDIVLLLEVIEHFGRDPMFCIAEINRILKPDGELLITTPNANSWKSVYKTLLGLQPMFYGKYSNKPGAYIHTHEYSPSEMKKIMDQAGLEGRVWTENCYSLRESPSALELIEFIGFSKENRGDTIFAHLKKKSGIKERYPRELYDVS